MVFGLLAGEWQLDPDGAVCAIVVTVQVAAGCDVLAANQGRDRHRRWQLRSSAINAHAVLVPIPSAWAIHESTLSRGKRMMRTLVWPK
jgi:hypothetical protein